MRPRRQHQSFSLCIIFDWNHFLIITSLCFEVNSYWFHICISFSRCQDSITSAFQHIWQLVTNGVRSAIVHLDFRMYHFFIRSQQQLIFHHICFIWIKIEVSWAYRIVSDWHSHPYKIRPHFQQHKRMYRFITIVLMSVYCIFNNLCSQVQTLRKHSSTIKVPHHITITITRIVQPVRIHRRRMCHWRIHRNWHRHRTPTKMTIHWTMMMRLKTITYRLPVRPPMPIQRKMTKDEARHRFNHPHQPLCQPHKRYLRNSRRWPAMVVHSHHLFNETQRKMIFFQISIRTCITGRLQLVRLLLLQPLPPIIRCIRNYHNKTILRWIMH